MKDYKKFEERLKELDKLLEAGRLDADKILILSMAAIFDYHKPNYDKLKEKIIL